MAASAAALGSPLPGSLQPARKAVAAFVLAAAYFALSALATAQQKSGAAKPPQPASAGSQPAQPRPAQIDRNGVLILVRSALAALDQANKTGNYTVLRDLGAPSFQAANTAARLGEIFASQRAQNLDLSGVLALDPQLTLLPQIEASGMMRMAGFFPSAPTQINFELAFAPVEGRWRLFGLSVNLGSAAPVPGPQGSAQDRKPAAAQAGSSP